MAYRLDSYRDRPRAMRKTQQGLAEYIGISKATLNEQLNGAGATRGLLFRLDKIAEYLDTTPAELVQRLDANLAELTTDEQRVIRHWRDFPPHVRDMLLAMLDYFGGLFPEEKEQRHIWWRWRRLTEPRRARVQTVLDLAWAEQMKEKTAKATTRGAPAPSSGSSAPAGARRRVRQVTAGSGGEAEK